MTIGVALAAYNGAQFLQEQLDTLQRQTRRPDHLVIRDDGSSDGTMAIAEEFQRTSGCRVDVIAGSNGTGPMNNFMRAADACDTDVVAFCDQDDIWLPGKLETCERVFARDQCVALVHSVDEFKVTDGQRTIVSRTDMPSMTVDGLSVPPNMAVLGMSMAVRKDALRAGLPLKDLWAPRFDRIAATRPVTLFDHWSHAHDMYALTVARLLGTVTFVSDVLALHRVHETNYSNSSTGWKQPVHVAESWGRDRNHGYRVLSSHCHDFAEMLQEDECARVLGSLRRAAAHAHYAFWARRMDARARLHASGASMSARVKEFARIVGNGGYRSRFAGGFGVQSIGKDALAVVGVRVG